MDHTNEETKAKPATNMTEYIISTFNFQPIKADNCNGLPALKNILEGAQISKVENAGDVSQGNAMCETIYIFFDKHNISQCIRITSDCDGEMLDIALAVL